MFVCKYVMKLVRFNQSELRIHMHIHAAILLIKVYPNIVHAPCSTWFCVFSAHISTPPPEHKVTPPSPPQSKKKFQTCPLSTFNETTLRTKYLTTLLSRSSDIFVCSLIVKCNFTLLCTSTQFKYVTSAKDSIEHMTIKVKIHIIIHFYSI